MAQWTFTCVDEDNCKTTMEFEGIFLPHVVEKMEEFLKGTGFFFDQLEFTKLDDDTEDDDLTQEKTTEVADDDIPGDPSY
tara:strand:- start:3858 stop:4097 length:240 start_codon:yes stop_codon:yes gene_type:complete